MCGFLCYSVALKSDHVSNVLTTDPDVLDKDAVILISIAILVGLLTITTVFVLWYKFGLLLIFLYVILR